MTADLDGRERLEALHGHLVLRRSQRSPPTSDQDLARAAYQYGQMVGAQHAIRAYDDDLDDDPGEDVLREYVGLSRSWRETDELVSAYEEDDDEDDVPNGFR